MARLYLNRLSLIDQFKVLDATITELERVKGMVYSPHDRARVQKSIRYYERRMDSLSSSPKG